MIRSILSPSTYIDEQHFDCEKNAIFECEWIPIALVSDVNDSGDVYPCEFAGWKFIVTKDYEGEIRVFLNSCLHRCMQLVDQPISNATDIRCPWHAWIYNLNGNLIGTPNIGGCGVDQSDFQIDDKYSLVSIRCELWLGFVFINPNGTATPLHRSLEQVSKRFNEFDFSRISHNRLTNSTIYNANWKLVLETSAEAYHHFTVHPEVPNMGTFRSDIGVNFAGIINNISSNEFAASTTNTKTTNLPPIFPHFSKDWSSVGYYWQSAIYLVFPLSIIVLTPFYLITILLTPLSPTKTESRSLFFFVDDAAKSEEWRDYRNQVRSHWEGIENQDARIANTMQEQMSFISSWDQLPRFVPFWESGIVTFQEYILNKLKSELV